MWDPDGPPWWPRAPGGRLPYRLWNSNHWGSIGFGPWGGSKRSNPVNSLGKILIHYIKCKQYLLAYMVFSDSDFSKYSQKFHDYNTILWFTLKAYLVLSFPFSPSFPCLGSLFPWFPSPWHLSPVYLFQVLAQVCKKIAPNLTFCSIKLTFCIIEFTLCSIELTLCSTPIVLLLYVILCVTNLSLEPGGYMGIL